MKISAALCWWNEAPDILARCIRGIAEIADRVVALDGSFRRYPGATVRSSIEQTEAITGTAREVGLECLSLQPDRLWAGAVEKRSYLLAAATVDTDWVAIVDADHIIHADREATRSELASFGPAVDMVSVPFFTPLSDTRSISETAATNWHGRLADKRIPVNHFIRALPGLRCERFHWWYSGIKDSQRVWVPYSSSGMPPIYPVHLATPLKARYEIEHLSLQRDDEHILAARAFYNDRIKVVAQTQQEDDVPGLFAPTWDYETVPY